MSIKHILQAFNAKVGNAARKLILIKLADNANDSGYCWPSHQYIADQCEMSKRSVIAHIAKLEELGFLTVQQRKKSDGGNRSNYYKLHIGSENSAPPSEKSAPSPSENSAPITCHSLETVKEPIGSSGDKPTAASTMVVDAFEQLWKMKPERQGANPKNRALSAYKQRIKDGANHEEIANGLIRYKKHLEEQQKLNTPFVMQMATFLGKDEHFKEQWTFNTEQTKQKRVIGDL